MSEPTQTNVPQEIYVRLNQNDRDIATTQSDVSHLRTAVREVLTEVRAIGQNMRRGPDWQAMAAWAGVLLVIIGGLGSALVLPLREQVVELQRERVETARELATLQERSRWLEGSRLATYP